MKKVLIAVLALISLGVVSCSKDCKCTERNSGYSTDAGKKTSSECSDYQKDLNRTANNYGYNQSWHCVTD